MNKILFIPLLVLSYACISPDEVGIGADEDALALDRSLNDMLTFKDGSKLEKVVELDGEIESKTITFDALVIKKDLKTLNEYSFARLLRSTNYNKVVSDGEVLFERKLKEKNGPISILISKNDQGKIKAVEMNFENENYLYDSSQSIQVKLENEMLKGYKVIGSRKLMGLDPSNYLIEVSVIRS